MTRRFSGRVGLVLVIAAALSAAGLTLAALNGISAPEVDRAAATSTILQLDPAASSCDEVQLLDYTPAVQADENSSIFTTAPGCKACKDRQWCKCTYNGLPRVSCNPCCYGNLGIPQVCFD